MPTKFAGPGHNSADVVLRIEARFFNSLAKYSGHSGLTRMVEVPAGTSIGDLVGMFSIPMSEIFLVLKNGRDITPGLYEGGSVNCAATVEDGDVIAFSGPVPYSYGYGAPVV